MLRAGGVSSLGGALVVVVERLLRRLHACCQHHVRIAALSRPLHGAAADGARDHDQRVRLLVGPRPRVHVAVLVVLAFEAERPRLRPGFDDELVRLLEAFPVVGRLGVVGDALAAGAPHPAGDEPATRDHVDDRQLFRQPERVIPDRQDVADEHDLRLLRDPREHCRFDVAHLAHAKRRAVVLVQREGIEAHFLRVELLVEEAVVEVGAKLWIVLVVAGVEVREAAAGCAPPACVLVLVGAFGKVADQHARASQLPLGQRKERPIGSGRQATGRGIRATLLSLLPLRVRPE